MTQPYLIAHVVRGAPAFDIAIRLCEGEAPCQPNCGLYPECKSEECWIIPTSGHRAYPYWWVELYKFDFVMAEDGSVPNLIPPCPPSWPDHYPTSASPKSSTIPTDLLSTLGLRKAEEPINRRSFK